MCVSRAYKRPKASFFGVTLSLAESFKQEPKTAANFYRTVVLTNCQCQSMKKVKAMIPTRLYAICPPYNGLRCFDAVGWVAGRASGL